MKYSTAAALLATIVLSACTPEPNPVTMQPSPQLQAAPGMPVQAAQPVIINQAPAQGSSTGDMLAAGAVGYMAGQALSGNNNRGYDRDYDRRPQVVHRTTVIKKTIIQQPKKPTYSYGSTTKKVSLSKSYRSGRR